MVEVLHRIGLIRVVSFTDEKIAGLHGRLIEERFPNLRVISRCIPEQPEGIYDDASEALAVPKVVELGQQMAKEEGIEALIISCAADPGVTQLREQVSIPIIGAGSAAAALALSYSDRVGALGITEGVPAVMKRILGSYLVGETKPKGVITTLDLMKPEGKKRAIEACQSLVQQVHCRVIALACTGMATIGVAREMEEAVQVPVIDPVVAAGCCAWFFVEGRSTIGGMK